MVGNDGIKMSDIDPTMFYPASKAARVLGKSESYLANMRAARTGPAFIKHGRTPLYRGSALIEYLEALAVLPTARTIARRAQRMRAE